MPAVGGVQTREAAEGEEVLPPLLAAEWDEGDEEEEEGGLRIWHYQGRRPAGE